MQHRENLKTFQEEKCRKNIIISYLDRTAEDLNKVLSTIMEFPGQTIIICVSDSAHIAGYVRNLQRKGNKGVNIAQIDRHQFPITLPNYSHHQVQMAYQNFQKGKHQKLFLLGCPYWDEVKSIDGLAENTVWINRQYGDKPQKDFMYYAIGLACKTAHIFTSQLIL